MTVKSRNAFDRMTSRAMWGVCSGFAVIILALLILVMGYLVLIGFSSLHLSFFTTLPIPKGDVGFPGGMANAIVGTMVLVIMAGLVGVPMGILTGIYLSEYDKGSWLATPVRFTCDVLAGVPSIVVGILGYELLVVPIGHYNAFAGSLALAFIMIPIVARTTEEMLRLVPNSYREASIALGAAKARTILGVVLPSATGSVVTGVMLSLARIAGETAPLLFTVLSSRLLTFNPRHPLSIWQNLFLPYPSLTVQIFNYSIAPFSEQQHLAWAGILVLISMIFILNLAIRYVTRSRGPAR